jgi:hypothetical protein
MAPISGNLAWAWLTQPLCAGGKSACDADNTAAQGTYFLIAVNSGLVAILYFILQQRGPVSFHPKDFAPVKYSGTDIYHLYLVF